MNRWDLTQEQCHQLLEKIEPALGFLSRLKRRIEQESFPADDRLRREVDEAQAAMQSLRMMLHYMTCSSGVFQNRPDR